MNRRTLIIFITSVIVLLIAGGAYFITFSAVGKLQEESFLLAEEIEASFDKEERINRAQRTLTLINSQENTVFEYLVAEETVVDFLEILEGIEEETKVEIDILSVAANTELDVFDVNLTVEGSFKRVMQTLGAIEKLPIFITIKNGTLETILRDGETESLWTASASYSVQKQ